MQHRVTLWWWWARGGRALLRLIKCIPPPPVVRSFSPQLSPWEAEKAERTMLQRERESRERRTELLAASSYSHQSSDKSMPLNGVSLSSPSAMKSPFKNKQTNQPTAPATVSLFHSWPLECVCIYICTLGSHCSGSRPLHSITTSFCQEPGPALYALGPLTVTRTVLNQ